MTRLTIDETIATLAAPQLGLVRRAQLLEAGVATGALDRRVKTRRLRFVQRGVYQVGPLVAPLAREMAAVLACGPDAFLSHVSAAVLWRLLREIGKSAPIHVTIRNADRGRRPGIRMHRVRTLAPDDVTVLENIPITSASRTILDLASTVGHRELEQALAQGERQGLVDRQNLLSLITGRPRRPGTRTLRALLQGNTLPALTRSEAEERFLRLIRKAHLTAPEVNVRVAGIEVDFLWRAERVVVEVDGFAYHSSPRQFETDRRRDARLAASGIQVIRLTWHQIVREPEATLVLLVQTLGHARAFRRSAAV